MCQVYWPLLLLVVLVTQLILSLAPPCLQRCTCSLIAARRVFSLQLKSVNCPLCRQEENREAAPIAHTWTSPPKFAHIWGLCALGSIYPVHLSTDQSPFPEEIWGQMRIVFYLRIIYTQRTISFPQVAPGVFINSKPYSHDHSLFPFTRKIGTCEKFQPCFKGFLCTATPLAKRLHLMSECENNVDLHASYKHCDLSNYEKLLHASPIDLLIMWDQLWALLTTKKCQELHLLCLLPLKAHTWRFNHDFPFDTLLFERKEKEEGREKGGRLAEASRNGGLRREESGGSVKGISAGSRSGKVEKLEPICHKEFPLNKLGGFLLKDPSAWNMWKVKQK